MQANNSAGDTAPQLSAILLTADTFQQIRKTLKAWSRQTVVDRVEMIIVCPSEARLGLVEEEVKGFHSVRVLGVGEIKRTSDGRAAAIRMAAAPVIALAEDHSYPEPGFAEALIEAHKGPWAGVGPAFLNANPGIVSWVAMVLDYGRWISPVPAGPIDDIPGHNSSWKRSLLLELGPDLEVMMPAPTNLNWYLASKGHRLYMEPAAKIRHLQVSGFWPCLVEQFHVARLFPAGRARHWPLYKRLFYVCAMPVLLGRNLLGWIAHFRRIDPSGKILATAWPMLLLMTAVWGAGEIAGYAFGVGRAQEETVIFDTNRGQSCNRRDRELQATY